MNPGSPSSAKVRYKDERLFELSRQANVAQFVSFAPDGRVRFSTRDETGTEKSTRDLVRDLIARSESGSVNVRSFHPDRPKANEFVYGLGTPSDVEETVARLGQDGLYTIVNETIDVNDGGVSGVALGPIVEFAPGDTPRAVEKSGVLSLSREIATQMLEVVYGFLPDLPFDASKRVEFSIHPLRQGARHTHTVVWELEDVGEVRHMTPVLRWPNRFSQLVGDKAFGLLLAHLLGERVPRTTVIARRIRPFGFGDSTGKGETWIRTSPATPVPGKFTTQRGWLDPFELLASEDRAGNAIASVLAQDGVEAVYSGGAGLSKEDGPVVEGLVGSGEAFMQGVAPPTSLPEDIAREVSAALGRLHDSAGVTRLEWVFDGESVWILQAHQGRILQSSVTIYPGTPKREHVFRVESGLEALRDMIDSLPEGDGVVIVGDVGVTSHLGDVLRAGEIPSRIQRSSQ